MKRFFYFIPLLVIVLLALFLYLSSTAPSNDNSKKVFVINQGENLLTIATRLQKYHYIKNKYTFILYSYFLGLNRQIQAGTFYLTTSQNLSDLIQKIATGGSQDYWLKIIPGTRIAQFTPSSEFTSISKDLEGQLFPDSYLIPQDYTPANILSVIEKNFNEKLIKAKKTATTKLTDDQTLIIASLLEREAKTLNDKKIIAGILINRLDSKMPLQVDATIQYARDSQFPPTSYWQPISKSDLNINSPYNTYKNRGLPPTPICNPGLESLIAAYHPTDSELVYYLSDSNGQIHYAKNLAEHNANVAKYLK